ncbi:hypothetical protein [Azohydromonas caseinilytica]|uniref:hypothetical protein n=1 Tax=Azohydromonas caseinilytica TaxID=2728836 RepID=UPI00197C1BA2|nr:hypothetical protein [Azohydromonas caseinilytica]
MTLLAATIGVGVVVVRNNRKTDQILEQLAELKLLMTTGHTVAPVTRDGAEPGHEPSRQDVPSRQVEDLSAEELQPTHLYFCTGEGKVILGIRKIERQRLARYHKSDLGLAESRLGDISGLLQAVPAVLTHANLVQGSHMEVLINGALAASRPGEALISMVKGANGRYFEQARLRNSPSLGRLSSDLAASIASAIAAQRYLEGVDSRLESFKLTLSELRDPASTERKPDIAEAMTYLKEKALPAVMRGEYSTALTEELDGIESKLIGVMRHLVRQHNALISQTKHVKYAQGVDTEDTFKLLSEHIKKIDATRKQYVISVRLRAMCCQFLFMFAQDTSRLEPRKGAIAEATEAPEIAGDFDATLQTILHQLDNLDTTLTDDKTLAHRRAAMRTFAQNTFENARTELVVIKEELDRLPELRASLQKPVRLAVRLDKGQLQAFDLSEAPPPSPALVRQLAAVPEGEADDAPATQPPHTHTRAPAEAVEAS